MIVVFDTDVILPMLLPASRSTRLYQRLRANRHTVAASQLIFDEVREKLLTDTALREWLALPERDLLTFVRDLPRYFRSTPGLVTAAGAVKDDPKDDKILAAAKEAGASYLISEDRHLRKLKVWEGIQIMNRDEFTSELDHLGVPQLAKPSLRKRKPK